jgi:hemerythrin-like domain-containing protein
MAPDLDSGSGSDSDSDSERRPDMREMAMPHRMFRREFGLMPALVRNAAPGDPERRRIVADHIDLVTQVFESDQHGEDTLWPKLRERVPAAMTSRIELIESQHAALDAIRAELRGAVDAWRKVGDTETGERLAAVADRMAAALGEHLAAEEELVVPLIEEYITAQEWEDVVQQEAADSSPEHFALLFGLVMYEADPGVIDAIVSGMPLEVRPIIKQLAADAYAAHAQVVHGTATPSRAAV